MRKDRWVRRVKWDMVSGGVTMPPYVLWKKPEVKAVCEDQVVHGAKFSFALTHLTTLFKVRGDEAVYVCKGEWMEHEEGSGDEYYPISYLPSGDSYSHATDWIEVIHKLALENKGCILSIGNGGEDIYIVKCPRTMVSSGDLIHEYIEGKSHRYGF